MQFPVGFIKSLQGIKGFDENAFKEAHELDEQITSIRINPDKSFHHPELQQQIAWCKNGYYLKERPSFTLDPLFHAGAYYVQEASSMFLEQVIRQTVDLTKPLRVLDLCAAPGGKSTHLQSLISSESLLISNEVIKSRVNILSENITKWGAANVIVTNNDPKDFQRLPNYFDVIVVDAPCSGSGLFRKDPNAMKEWSEQNVQTCSMRQQRILADVVSSLKEKGVLIYSTCSYSQQEDEDMADWFVNEFAMESLKLSLDSSWNIIQTQSEKTNAYGYRFYPDQLKGEGFFITCFTKRKSESGESSAAKRKLEIISGKETGFLKSYIQHYDDFIFIKQNEEAIAIPKNLINDFAIIQSSLYLKKAGIRIGSIIRNELIPSHELAVSNLLHQQIQKIEVGKETALNYLRKQEIRIETDVKGWVILTFQSLPLGWIKVLNNRINNYYPKEWRILNK